MILDVLIVYEHVARELESALLLEKKLRKLGLKVKIVKCAWTEHAARLLYKPKVIVTPWCYDDTDYDFFRGYVGGYEGGKFQLVNLHCEQITDPSGIMYMLPSGKAKACYHFIWGNYFYDKMVEVGVNPETIFITGNPRLDFFREEYKKVCYRQDELSEQFGISREKKWVLIIGSFSGEILRGDDISYLEDRGYDDTRVFSETVYNSYYGILDWLDIVCHQDIIKNNYEFIYRPHPSEIITDALTELETKYSNFHVIRSYAIRDWMVNSDMLFAWNSTSAVEAVSAGKHIFFLRPVEMPESLKVPLLETVEQLCTPAEFSECLINHLSGQDEHVNDAFKKELTYYYDDSSVTAVDHMVNCIVEILSSNRGLITSNSKWKDRLRCFIKFILKYILHKLGLLKKVVKNEFFYADILTKAEFKKYVTRINRLEETNESQ